MTNTFSLWAQQIHSQGYAFGHYPMLAMAELAQSWHHLTRDAYLADGGRYRLRRHASLIQSASTLTAVPYRPHWQPTTYNALHGGITRHFAEVDAAVLAHPAMQRVISELGGVFNAADGLVGDWYIEVHQFRIDPSEGVGRPTPEGAHRDGVDYVALLMMNRVGIDGGDTTVYDATGQLLMQHTLQTAGELMLLDDERVKHATTEIRPQAAPCYRDTLVITYRRGGFLQAG
jgi:hypothetical protein